MGEMSPNQMAGFE